MPEKSIHMRFRDYASISLLLATVEKEFPLIHSSDEIPPVDESGKVKRLEFFRKLREFSTSFPHKPVDEITQQ